ncbi:hypothetical protein NL676_018840 [Syzygium grande]|nr:hypothetical protein NL676_018840 [Syzygium grande]
MRGVRFDFDGAWLCVSEMARERLLLLGVAVALLACWFGSLASAQIIHPAELSALKAIRSNLDDPFNNLRNWKKNDPCTSNWTGVICTQILADGYLHVHELRLLKMNLTGTLAPELGVLTYVTYFHMNNNSISGQIPPELYKLQTLKHFLLDNNNLSGYLPPELHMMPSLTILQLDNNNFEGNGIPSNYSNMPKLLKLSLRNCNLAGVLPDFSTIPGLLYLEFQNNALTNIVGSLNPPPNVTIRLQGNPVCRRENELDIVTFCAPEDDSADAPANSTHLNNSSCPNLHCPGLYEHVPDAPDPCYCAAPLGVGIRLRSPSISDFPPYAGQFTYYITSNLDLELYQLVVDSFIWQKDVSVPSSGMSKGVLAAIVLGSISSAGVICLAIAFLFYLRHPRTRGQGSRTKSVSKVPLKVEGIKEFSFADLEKATSNFDITAQIGQGGYGKVYKGVMGDSTVVAIKRAEQRSLQGQKEFFTEIEFLSRLHHRNLVALVGYCDEQSEQVLQACQSGSMFSIIDRSMGPYPSECIKKFMALALKCCEDQTKGRPTMLEVVRELENISSMLPETDTITSESEASGSGIGILALSLFTPGEVHTHPPIWLEATL